MPSNPRSFDMRLFAAFVVAALLAVFYLPYRVPMKASDSFSYTFGYNNRAGVILLLAFLAVGTVWTKGWALPPAATGESPKVSRRTLALSLLLVLAGCLSMWVFAGRFGGFGESTYEIDRIWLTSIGKVPYVDFEWPFGISLLYLPLALKTLFSLTLWQAAYLFWVLNFLVGTVLLYLTVNMIDYPTRSRKTIFLLFFAAGTLSIMYMGTHYTFLRYTFPIFIILCVQKLANRATVRPPILAAALAVVGTMLLLTISPETAIAQAFACACVLAPSRRRWTGPDLAVYAGLLTGDLLVFGLALKLHVLDTVRASGGGADSFPILPSAHILFFVTALFVCASYLFHHFAVRSHQPAPSGNTFGILAFSLPMLAAALGRCAPDHVLWNGEGVFLASMFYVSNNRFAWKAYRVGFLAIFILVAGLTQGISYLHTIARVGLEKIVQGDASAPIRALDAMGRHYFASHGTPTARARWNSRLSDLWRYGVPERIDFAELYPSWRGEFFVPFFYRPNGIGSYHSSQIHFGYYEGTENANTPAAIQERIAELKDRPHEALLLPDDFENSCVTDVDADRSLLRLLFAAPYSRKALHPENIRRPVCDYIREHYRLAEAPDKRDFYYGLWVPLGTGER